MNIIGKNPDGDYIVNGRLYTHQNDDTYRFMPISFDEARLGVNSGYESSYDKATLDTIYEHNDIIEKTIEEIDNYINNKMNDSNTELQLYTNAYSNALNCMYLQDFNENEKAKPFYEKFVDGLTDKVKDLNNYTKQFNRGFEHYNAQILDKISEKSEKDLVSEIDEHTLD